MLQKTISISKLRERLSEYIDQLEDDGTLVVMRHSEPAAYLLSPDLFEQMVGRLEELLDLHEAYSAMDDLRRGENVEDAEEVFKRLGI